MAKLLKLRRGTTTQHGSFTGAEGEVTIDTDKDVPVVHDGSTQGGHPVAAEDLANVSSATIAGRLNNDSLATSKIAAGALPTDVTVADANISGNLTIESADIVDGTIVNADVNASAAIAGSKLANPISLADDHKISFGTGSDNNLEIFHESSSNTNEIIAADGDIHIQADNFMLISDDTAGRAIYLDNGNSRLELGFDGNDDAYFTGSGVTFSTNVDANAGLDVTGTITSTGNITTNGQINIASTSPRLHLDDTNSEDDFSVYNQNGSFLVYNEDDNRADITIASDGQIDFAGNVDCNSGLDVTGNITVSGTVDGVDVAALKTAKDSLSASNGVIKSGVELASGVITSTQAQSDNSTKVASTAYVRSAVAGVVDSAPATLDTLNELAAALGDDANFSTTITNSIGTKMPLSGGTFTGNVTVQGDLACQGGTGAISVGGGSDIRLTGGSWTGEFTSGIKIQPNTNDSYFQYQGGLYFRNPSGSNLISFDSSANIVASGNITAYSDERLKENIQTINNALGICGKLRGVSYKWKDANTTSIGVIAQEVEAVIPDIVLTNTYKDPADGTETEVKSVDYGKIVGVLINAINELKAEVDALKGGS